MSDLENNITYKRLEDQLGWYDKKSQHCQWWYKKLRLISLILATSIPLTAPYVLSWVSGTFGALIAIIEGVQALNQYHDHWFTYRSTCESLKHEKFLYLAKSGPYADIENPQQVLAERLEKTVSQEHAKWVDSKEMEHKSQWNAG